MLITSNESLYYTSVVKLIGAAYTVVDSDGKHYLKLGLPLQYRYKM